MGAIRDHVAAAVTAGLPVTDTAQTGDTEARCRAALIASLVPRAKIVLETRRETLGGEHDLSVISDEIWLDDQDREWLCRVAQQEIVVTVTVWHRLETLADEAVLRIASELDDSLVVWPGDFDARVSVGGVVVTQRLSGGTYTQQVRLLNRAPARWDGDHGLLRSTLQATVQSVSQLRPATQSVRVDAEFDKAFVVG